MHHVQGRDMNDTTNAILLWGLATACGIVTVVFEAPLWVFPTAVYSLIGAALLIRDRRLQ